MFKKSFLIKFLSATVAATLAMTPVTAFAEAQIEIDADDQDKKADLGDVSTDSDDVDAVSITADGHNADITTGNISVTSADRNGLYTKAENSSEINVDVTGDIHTPEEESTGEAEASGVAVNTYSGSQQHMVTRGSSLNL